MSEPKLISPLLDSFAMGPAISSHDGVSCYPAMKEGSDDRYIVKIISIPASQKQLDALLLSGAYPDAAAANVYFKDLVSDIDNEVEVLRRLARLEGFAPFEGMQVVPMEDGVGFDVYLLSYYRSSLEKHFQRKPMTHLGAVNLGIDLCSAMSVCRQAGCLYTDLKPSNIFITPEGRYCVGDLGLVPQSSLQYASLPDKYRSSWTAPEIKDAFSNLNKTMDIYAIGLVLYQAYNNGALPFTGDAPSEVLPPPEYADYEMAEIILKACAPAPEDRWQTPAEMGQALVSHMQRNGANDVPIVPPPVPQEEPAAEESPVDPAEAAEANAPAEEEAIDAPAGETLQPEEDAAEEDELSPAASDEEVPESGENPEEESEPDFSLTLDPVEPAEQLPDELAFISSLVSDETAPCEEDLDIQGQVTEELSSILAQADELLAHEPPAPAVAPEAVEIPMPDPIVPETEEDDAEPAEDEASLSESESEEESEAEEEDDAEESAAVLPPKPRKSHKKLISSLIAVIVVLALAAGCLYFYQNYYLQSVDGLTISGQDDSMLVKVDSPVADSLLTVICTDTYGNVKQSAVKDGAASFDALSPNTHYTVTMKIAGFHQLTGETSGTYATPPQTNVVSFIATAGPEDGSVILNFTVDGAEAKVWNVVYSAEGEAEQTASFSSHTTTISGLSVGKDYTFRIVPEDELFLTGETELTFTASTLIVAENLKVEGCTGDSLTLSWKAPADTSVKEWTVHCYNEKGFDQIITTADSTAVFTGVDTSVPNTVEVTAAGMTKCARLIVSENPVTITDIRIFNSAPSQMTVEWDYSGVQPAEGWFLTWSIEGSTMEFGIPCSEPSGIITSVVPGAVYHFDIQTASGSSVFGGVFNSEATAAVPFEGYGASAANMQFHMLPTPDIEDWSRYDVSESDYTTEFAVGQRASFLIYLAEEYEVDYADVTTLFVIRDASGSIIDLQTSVRRWVDMWYDGFCELDMADMPTAPGAYSVDIYFNGQSVTSQNFTVK